MALGPGKFDKYLIPIVDEVDGVDLALLVVIVKGKVGVSLKMTSPMDPTIAMLWTPLMRDVIRDSQQEMMTLVKD